MNRANNAHIILEVIYLKSVWSMSRQGSEAKQLDGNITTDVLIIGAGMAGILCAYFLKERGIDYVLVDGGRAGDGITCNTTAKITAQHSFIYQEIVKSYGVAKAEMYLKANMEALDKYLELGQKVDCNMEKADSYVYSSDMHKVDNEIKALLRIGYKTKFIEKVPLPVTAAGAVGFEGQAHFNPLMFIDGIKGELNLYENTYVKELDGRRAITDKGVISAAKIIIATHFPFINRHGFYFMKMYQHRSYVVAIKPDYNIDAMYVDENDKGMSFRQYEDMLFVGGGGHKTGKHGGGWQELRQFIKRNYPDSQEVCHWAAQDCMTLDKIPYIGEYSSGTAGLYVATGFNKWGMTSSMVSAMILADMIEGKENDYAKVFDPSRSMLKPQILANLGSTVKNLITPTSPRCTHLGCALKWNKPERTWDCPCHGSRYDENGNIIDNPAMRNLKK